MQTRPVGIIGASGYAGVEASRLLAGHPGVELRLLASDRWVGETAGKRAGVGGTAAAVRYAPQQRAAELARECAAVLLATPHEVSLALVPGLLEAGVRVVDLSGAFRLRDPEAFRGAYGLAHPCPALALEAHYGLCELSRTPEGARLVANPGCYATAAGLALAPLCRAGVLARERVIVDAASGTTGAGRKATEELSFSETEGDFRAYRVLRHQHQPEMAQTLAQRVIFTAHLLPVRRGILATCYARLAPGRDAAAARGVIMHHYAAAPFIEVLDNPDEVSLKGVVGTNRCQLAVAADGDLLIVVAALDNLVKGAAGQAVQNLNLMFGWPETLGLDGLRRMHP